MSFKIYFEKTDSWQQIYIQTSSTFHTPNDVCLRSNVLRRKIISNMIFKKLKHVPLYKSVEAHTSVNAYETANGVNQKTIKNLSKEFVT